MKDTEKEIVTPEVMERLDYELRNKTVGGEAGHSERPFLNFALKTAALDVANLAYKLGYVQAREDLSRP